MDMEATLAALKELTLALAQGRRTRQSTVEELYKRIDADSVYKMKPDEPQADFITQLFVSLEHLTEEGFATSPAEIKYFAECFEGKRTFSQEEVRKFPIGNFEKDDIGRRGKASDKT
jgi:hypothetical protein